MATIPEKMDLQSMSITDEQKSKLKQLFPEVFNEDKIDFDKLRRTLAEDTDEVEERFGMTWPGKNDCFKVIQTPSIGTLKPAKDESVDWDKTDNLFIEGDNLEVLKLLQRAYYGKIKMIYIDPPYNTGSQFIYPDDYTESLDTYLSYSGQKGDEGKKFSSNPESSGRFHSKWLNMMYSRIYLARNLLRDDGMMFVSIDDNELAHLRRLCDEIFGEENFIGLFVISSSPSAIDYGHIAKVHDYAIFYAKNIDETVTFQLPEPDKEFKYNDEKGHFNLYPLYHGNVAFNPKTRPNLYYPFFVNPANQITDRFYEIGLEEKKGWIPVYPVVSRKDNIQHVWRWSRKKAKGELNQEIIGYKTEGEEFRIVQKTRHTGKVIRSMLTDTEVSSRRGTGELESLFGAKVFSFPKPIELIKRFIRAGTSKDDIILDFFAGSAPTAHAVFTLNQEDGSNRRFILVQLPEPCDSDSEARKSGYETIAEIGKERIRRVISRISQDQEIAAKENEGRLPGVEEEIHDMDLGFKVFKLDKSNFSIWDGTVDADQDVSEQIELFVDHIDSNSSNEDILYEILLKAGFGLTTRIKNLDLAGKHVYSVADNALLICLDRKLTKEVITEMAKLQPARVVCLDAGFANNDQLKTNAVQIMKSHEVEDFRTV